MRGDPIWRWDEDDAMANTKNHLFRACFLGGLHMGASQNGAIPQRLFIVENPMKMDDLGAPPFQETPRCFFHAWVPAAAEASGRLNPTVQVAIRSRAL